MSSLNLLTDLAAQLATALPTHMVEYEGDEIAVGHGVDVRLNAYSGALEVHAPALGRGPIVSVSAQLPRGYQLRTMVEAVQNVVAVVTG